MHGLGHLDEGREIDWGRVSADYAAYRPGPPLSFYDRMKECGVGLPEQKILDLGTGTGVLARQFARQGCMPVGADISAGQIEVARGLADHEKLKVDFFVTPSEDLIFGDGLFDVITANQCFLYFDKEKTIPEIRRVLKPGGIFSTSHFCWLPLQDEIAARTEELILEFNPRWTAAGYAGEIPAVPDWSRKDFGVVEAFYYDDPVRFTRVRWRGRIKACRAIGAALSEDEIKRFDAAHAELLEKIAPPEFDILHRVDAHIFEFK
ncbi:MAG: class I SAM-dependent methyltransferase [Elusimicrobiota bacterium]